MAGIPRQRGDLAPEGLAPGDHACLILEEGDGPAAAVVAFVGAPSDDEQTLLCALEPDALRATRELWQRRGAGPAEPLWREPPADHAALEQLLEECCSADGLALIALSLDRIAAGGREQLLRAEATIERFSQRRAARVLCLYSRLPGRANLLLEAVRVHSLVASGGVMGLNCRHVPAAQLLAGGNAENELDDALGSISGRPLGDETTGPEPDAPGSETSRDEPDTTGQSPAVMMPHWAAVINATGDAVMTLTTDGTVTAWNPAAEESYGYSAAEMAGRSFLAMTAPGHREELRDVLRRVKDGLTAKHHQTVQLRRSGRRIETDLTLAPMAGAAGKVEGITVFARDVTAYKRLRRAPQESQQRFRTVLESVRDVAYKIDLQHWEFSYVSPSVEELLGFTAAEVIALGPTGLFRRVHPEDAGRLRRLTEFLLEDRRDRRREPRIEYRLRTRDGRTVWVSESRRLLRDAAGRPEALVATMRDVTHRKEAETKLESMASAPMAEPAREPAHILYKDENLRFVWVNETAAAAMGVSPEEAVGKTDFDFWPRELAEKYRAEDRAVLKSGHSQTITDTDYYGDGRQISWESRKVPTRDADGRITGLLIIMTDIRGRQKAAGALAQWNAMARSSDDAILGLSVDGRVLTANAGAKRLLGFTATEMTGRPLAEMASPGEAETLEDALRRVAEGEHLRNREISFRCGVGGETFLSLNLCPIVSGEGQITGISALGRDVTARKRSEEALRSGGTPLDPFFSGLEQKYWIKDAQLSYVHAHRSYTDYLGIEQDEIAGKTDFDVYPPELAERYQAEDRAVMEAGETVLTEQEVHHEALGETSVRRHLKIPLTDANGAPAGLVGIWWWPELQSRLKETLCHWGSLVASTDDAVIGVGLDGTILSWNPGAEALYGYARDEVVEQPFTMLAAAETCSETENVFDHAVAGRSVQGFETTHRTRDGCELDVSLTLSPIVGPEGKVTGISATARDVTTRKRAERDLRDSERRFRTVLESVSDLAYKYDLATETYDYVSPSAEVLFGFSAEQVAAGGAEGHFARVHPDDVERVVDATHRLIAEGSEPPLEYRYRHREGHYIWVSDSRRLLWGEDGEPDSIVGLARDITGRKEVEWALRQTAGSLRPLLDRIQERVFVKDRDLRFIYVNQPGARCYGLEPEQMIGKTDYDLYPDNPDLAEKCRRDDLEVIEDGSPRHYVEQIPQDVVAGHAGVREWDKIPVKDERGRVVAVVGVQNWLAGPRTGQELLAHWAAIVQSSGDAIVGLTIEGEILSWNPGAERMTGYEADEVRGKSLDIIVPPDRLEVYRENLSRVTGGRNVVKQEGRYLRKDGSEGEISFTMSPIAGPDGRPLAVSFIGRDITERRHLEARMRQAEKLESLAILAGGVAHDFNNLLTGVLGNAGLALLDLPEDSPARYSIEKIQESARHAAELAAQMLAYSGKGRFTVEPVQLCDLVQEMKGLLEAATGPGISVDYELADDLPLVQGDPAQLKQVLLNLVINASEAIGQQEGVIRVQAEQARPAPEFFADAHLQGRTDAERYTLLRVADSGCGMDAETSEQVFDPFFSTKFTGRGLGLAAVLGIVRGHDGSIRVRSRPGQGSTFEVLLPAGGT